MATILTEHLNPAAQAAPAADGATAPAADGAEAPANGEAAQAPPAQAPLLQPTVVAPQTISERPKLTIGEVLDVLEGPRKEEATGLTRIKVKVRSSGAEGWVTARG